MSESRSPWGVEAPAVLARIRAERPTTLAALKEITGEHCFDPDLSGALTDIGWALVPVIRQDNYGARHPQTGAYIEVHEGVITYEDESLDFSDGPRFSDPDAYLTDMQTYPLRPGLVWRPNDVGAMGLVTLALPTPLIHELVKRAERDAQAMAGEGKPQPDEVAARILTAELQRNSDE